MYRPQLSRSGLDATETVSAVDEFGEARTLEVAGERALTLVIDGREIVTLMTLGSEPEALTLGYIRNQKLIDQLDDIVSIDVNWDLERATVTTRTGDGAADWQEKLQRRIITSGCGQGTIFSCTVDKLYEVTLPKITLKQSDLYALLTNVNEHNSVYRTAGAVHSCACCSHREVLIHVEDVGRHNAADAVAGHMWLNGLVGGDKIFYTTGRLTSEIVMKTAFMGIPVLLSRSGVTAMGLELAREIGMVMIARAKGRHFLVYNGAERVQLDAMPEKRSVPPLRGRLDA